MTSSNHHIRLSLLALLLCSGAQAQKITRVDSVLLFRTAAKITATNGDVVATKGKITHTEVRPDGSADIYVFKQHAGILKPTTKIKGLPATATVVPGLMHLRVEPGGGITTVSDEIFNLNSGLRQPIGYELYDIDGTRSRKDAPVVITSDKHGTDYNAAIKKNPVAFGYLGDSRNVQIYDVPDRSSLVTISQQNLYSPFSASTTYLTPKRTKVMTLSAKPLPLTASPLIYTTDEAGTPSTTIAFRPDDGAFVTLDSLGKTVRAENLPELKGLRPLAVKIVHGENKSGMRDILEVTQTVGVDYVLGLTTEEKGYKEGNYWIVRLANDGKVLFKHPFKVVDEDFSPSGSFNLASNATECIVRVGLRKGILKYKIANVKVNADGVVYNRILTADELKALPTTRAAGEGTMDGSLPSTDWHLFSLPSGENLIVGNLLTSDKLQSYSFLHINADGSLKRIYQSTTPDRNLDARVKRMATAVLLTDGRLLLVADESTGISKAPMAPYSTLESNLSDGYPAETQGVWNKGEQNLLFNPTVTGEKVERKGAMGFLEKLANTTEVGSLSAQPAKAQSAAEVLDAPMTAPVVMLLDLKTEKLTRYSLGKTGGYSIPNQPLLYVDAAKGKFTYVSRTLPEKKAKPLDNGRGGEVPGSGVFLKVVQGEL